MGGASGLASSFSNFLMNEEVRQSGEFNGKRVTSSFSWGDVSSSKAEERKAETKSSQVGAGSGQYAKKLMTKYDLEDVGAIEVAEDLLGSGIASQRAISSKRDLVSERDFASHREIGPTKKQRAESTQKHQTITLPAYDRGTEPHCLKIIGSHTDSKLHEENVLASDNSSSTPRNQKDSHSIESLDASSTTNVKSLAAIKTTADTNEESVASSSQRRTDCVSHGKSTAQNELPIMSYKQTIIESVKRNKITLVSGAAGCGKTTKVPQFLHEAGFSRHGMIAITQPRRIATVTLAQRVAKEMNQKKVGLLVGYNIRFHDVTCPETQIKFMTDGMLIRECMLDMNFRRYSVIIIDEAHERSLRSDTLLGIFKLQLSKLPLLKIVIMSATLDHSKFQDFFGSIGIVDVPGRQHPVGVFHTTQPEEVFLEENSSNILNLQAALITILQIHLRSEDGDILVFLPGQEDIETLKEMLEKKKTILNQVRKSHKLLLQSRRTAESSEDTATAKLRDSLIIDSVDSSSIGAKIGQIVYENPEKWQDMLILTIFASLPVEQQVHVFKKTPPKTRKIVLATNIAETSITLSGIRYVIDSGLVKVKIFDAKSGLDFLKLQEISKASAIQRAGRAGRESAGEAYRLYTESAYSSFFDHIEPEIMRTDLTQVYLELKAMKIVKPESFPFLEAPSKDSLYFAGKTLLRLGALDDHGDLTELGKKLACLPLSPLLGNLLLCSAKFGCCSEILSIVAVLCSDTIFFTPSDLSVKQSKALSINRSRISHPDGDHLTLLNAYLIWEEVKIACLPFFLSRDIFITLKKPCDECLDILLLILSSYSQSVTLNTTLLVQKYCLKKHTTTLLCHSYSSSANLLWCKNIEKIFIHQSEDKAAICRDYGLNSNSLWRAASIREQLKEILLSSSLGVTSVSKCENMGEWYKIRQCLTLGCWMNAARLDGNTRQYVTEVSKQIVNLHPSCGFFGDAKLPSWIIYSEFIETKKPYVRLVSVIEGSWLSQYVPRWFTEAKQSVAH